MSGALIVTAEFAPADLAWLDRLRRAHFPPERNQLPAHLTLFHALPPSAESEANRLLGQLAASPAPRASIEGLLNLGRGVAYRVVSPDLEHLRYHIAEHFHGLLTAQDAAGWRPHITIQNKVEPSTARALKSQLEAEFRPLPIGIRGLGLHRYLGGPWQRIAVHAFRGN